MKIGTLQIEELQVFKSAMCNIGPREAAALLERNTFNRKMSSHCVEKYCKEMTAGEWCATSAGIGIDENGVLTDGQNRLSAIIKYGKSVPVLIVTGLPSMARAKVDRHNKRSIASALYLSGIMDKEDSKGVQVATFPAVLAGGGRSPADCEIAASYATHEKSISVIEKLFGSTHKKGIAQVGVRAAMVLAYELHGNKAVEFSELIRSDVHSRADHPAFRLRKSLAGETVTRKRMDQNGAGRQMMAFERTVYAFNAFAEGRFINSVLTAKTFTEPKLNV
jgi:hypothetical protein